MRNLEREIGNVCRKVAKRRVVKDGQQVTRSGVEAGENVNDFLGRSALSTDTELPTRKSENRFR